MLAERLRQNSVAYSSHSALEQGGVCLTYKQMWEAADEMSDLFGSLGIGPGQVVAVCARNSLEVALTFLAIWGVGGVVYPVRAEEGVALQRALEGGYEPEAILLESEPGRELEAMLSGWYSGGYPLARSGLRMWRRIVRPFSAGSAAESQETVLWLSSSGSGGVPKTIKLGLEGTLANIRANSESLALNRADRTLMCLPLSYGYGLVAQFLSHLHAGGTVVFPPHPNLVHGLAGLVKECRITTCFTVPVLLRMLLFLASEDSEVKHLLASLRLVTVGGEFLDWPSLGRAWRLVHPADLAVTYGLSEAGPRVSTHHVREWPANSGCIGRPISGVVVKIVDERGVELPSGSEGEIAVFGPSVMQGYAGREDGGCYTPGQMVLTGDLGYYSEGGDLYVLGRKSEVVEIDGVRLHLNRLKEELYGHSSVLHVDATLAHGRRPPIHVKVLPKPGGEVRAEDLRKRYCAKWPYLTNHIELAVTNGRGPHRAIK